MILLGQPCSVMANAILRAGAIPVFADIDTNTLGSTAIKIENMISTRKKLFVAQHSFGILCFIEPIV